jgi:AcrR family transcriptional regulator
MWSRRQVEILDGLQEVFLTEGFRHLTIADLVDRLRCSRRTLYNLAPSREELVLLVIDRMLTDKGAQARHLSDSHDDPGEAVSIYLDAAVTMFVSADRAFSEDLESYLPTKHLYDRHVTVALRVLGRLIHEGANAGAFRPLHPPLVAEILDAAVERIRRPEVLARAGLSSSEAIEEVGCLIRQGLQAPD